MKPTQKQAILELMSDGDWHDNRSLNNIAFRYTGRLFELRKDGYQFEERHEGSHWFWRLKVKQYEQMEMAI